MCEDGVYRQQLRCRTLHFAGLVVALDSFGTANLPQLGRRSLRVGPLPRLQVISVPLIAAKGLQSISEEVSDDVENRRHEESVHPINHMLGDNTQVRCKMTDINNIQAYKAFLFLVRIGTVTMDKQHFFLVVGVSRFVFHPYTGKKNKPRRKDDHPIAQKQERNEEQNKTEIKANREHRNNCEKSNALDVCMSFTV